jgi:hypothetical protein
MLDRRRGPKPDCAAKAGHNYLPSETSTMKFGGIIQDYGMVGHKCSAYHCKANKVYYQLVCSNRDDDFCPETHFRPCFWFSPKKLGSKTRCYRLLFRMMKKLEVKYQPIEKITLSVPRGFRISNPRPFRCKRNDLPLMYQDLMRRKIASFFTKQL